MVICACYLARGLPWPPSRRPIHLRPHKKPTLVPEWHFNSPRGRGSATGSHQEGESIVGQNQHPHLHGEHVLPRGTLLLNAFSLGLRIVDRAYLTGMFNAAYEKERFKCAFRSLPLD
jgi:hypothetical protein